MTLIVNHPNNVARLYDVTKDNRNELNVSRDADGHVIVGMEDRDNGDVELWITVSYDELAAALAITNVKHRGQDDPPWSELLTMPTVASDSDGH